MSLPQSEACRCAGLDTGIGCILNYWSATGCLMLAHFGLAN